jgi:hypothetical protein
MLREPLFCVMAAAGSAAVLAYCTVRVKVVVFVMDGTTESVPVTVT